MLRFFRQIRQRLLTNSHFSKYLLYAIGEILLVVIGILIALQINNWNEEKKEQRVQKQLYQNILNDLIIDAENIDSMITRLTLKQDLHYYLYGISQNDEEQDPDWKIWRVSSAPELLLITGRNQQSELELIKDLEIRREVNAYVKKENAAISDAQYLENLIKNKVREYFRTINAIKIDTYFPDQRYDNQEVENNYDPEVISQHFTDLEFRSLLVSLRMATSNSLITLGILQKNNKQLQTLLREGQ